MNAKSANSNGCTSNWTGDSSFLFPYYPYYRISANSASRETPQREEKNWKVPDTHISRLWNMMKETWNVIYHTASRELELFWQMQSHLIILHFHVKAILCGRKLRELLAYISSQFPRFWHYNPRWPTILRALARHFEASKDALYRK